MSEFREDFREILRLVRPGARVLDVGCGEGTLLDLLQREKGVDGRGIEISHEGVAACLAKGLAVMQGDADRDLAEFPPHAFDYAVLSQTLQAVREPRKVLSDLLRLADRAIVSLPNFGYWRVRWSLLTHGRMPETRALPETLVGHLQHPPLHAAGFHRPLHRPWPPHRGRRRPGAGPRRPPHRSGPPDRELGAPSRPCSCSAAAAAMRPSGGLGAIYSVRPRGRLSSSRWCWCCRTPNSWTKRPRRPWRWRSRWCRPCCWKAGAPPPW